MMPIKAQGLYFEEFIEGLEIESPGRTITEADITLFAGLSGDYNPLHTDAAYAAETPFGQRVAHGLLGLSIASGLASRTGILEGTTLAFRSMEWKFKVPVLIGDTVKVFAVVTQRRALRRLGGGQVVFSVKLVNQRKETVQQGRWSLLIKSRDKEQTSA